MSTTMIQGRCELCQRASYVLVPSHKVSDYMAGLGDVQVLFPDLTVGQRETLISGMHSHCFDAAMLTAEEYDTMFKDRPQPPEFRATFGQKYRTEPHPLFPTVTPDHYVSIYATDVEKARSIAFAVLDTAWAFLYPVEEYDDDEWLVMCPLGRAGLITEDLIDIPKEAPHAEGQ